MNRAWMGLACVVGLAGPALGADLRTAPPPMVAVPAWSWSGGYAGLNGGWGFGSADFTFHPSSAFAPGASFDHDLDGGLFGFQVGHNWQFGNVVFGLEGTTAWTGIEGNSTRFGSTFKTEIESLSTFTPRLGVTNGPWLLYGKAGVAYGTVKSRYSDGADSYREKSDHVGWTAGVGLEYALAPNWILGAEYNYVDLGDQRYGGVTSALDVADSKVDIAFSTVLARLSYKFGAGGNPLTSTILGPVNTAGLWNGLYLGVHGGYGWGDADLSGGDYDIDGSLIGGHIGYMTQFGNWVVGSEASIAWSGVKGSESIPGARATTELNWLATVTGRLGYSFGPWLVYAKGGGAFAEVDSEGSSTLLGPELRFSESEDHIGWTIGAGVEYAWDNWLFGVEYNYVDLGDQRYGGFTTPDDVGLSYRTDITVSTVLARLSYRFGEPAPVVAKY